MTENELNKFRDYSSERLTEVLVDLFLQIDKVHENDFQAYTHFCLTDLSVGAGDRLHIQLTEFQRLNVASRHQNYRDFVAIVCMICTGEGPESYVPGKITSPVLSEIVATLGSGSRSEGDLLYKLRHDYTGGDSFRGDTRNTDDVTGQSGMSEQQEWEDDEGLQNPMAENISNVVSKKKKSYFSSVLGLVGMLAMLFGSTLAYQTCMDTHTGTGTRLTASDITIDPKPIPDPAPIPADTVPGVALAPAPAETDTSTLTPASDAYINIANSGIKHDTISYIAHYPVMMVPYKIGIPAVRVPIYIPRYPATRVPMIKGSSTLMELRYLRHLRL